MSVRTPFPIFKSSSDSRVALLQGLMIAALVIGGLYVGKEVLLPLAVAILLSFVLTPLLIFLRKLKVPRVLAVVIVVTFAFSIISAERSTPVTDAAPLVRNQRPTRPVPHARSTTRAPGTPWERTGERSKRSRSNRSICSPYRFDQRAYPSSTVTVRYPRRS